MMKVYLPLILLVVFLTSTVLAANTNLDQINQKVCNRFEEDVLRMAAIMEEVRSRKEITETRVAFGGADTPIKVADYWVNFAAEAIAFQRVQKFSSKNELKYSLETLKNKILTAKNAVGKVLND